MVLIKPGLRVFCLEEGRSTVYMTMLPVCWCKNLCCPKDFFGRNDAKPETPVLWQPHAELTQWKRLWCWEGLGAGGEGDDRGWDGWMASLTRWTWVWVNSGSWWWTGRPGVLRFMGLQRVGHDWVTELNWTELKAWISSKLKRLKGSDNPYFI